MNLKERRELFDKYFPKIVGQEDQKKYYERDLPNTCPSCGYYTIEGRDKFDICPICWWEDDGQDDPHADEVWGGPNKHLSLTVSRQIVEGMLADFKKGEYGLVDKKLAEHILELDRIVENFKDGDQQAITEHTDKIRKFKYTQLHEEIKRRGGY